MEEKKKMKKLVATLIEDDFSRIDEVEVETDGRKAIRGWLEAAKAAGDEETIADMAQSCGCDDWEKIIQTLAPVWEELLAQWKEEPSW